MEGGQGLGYGGGGGGYSPNPSPSPSHSHSASATSSGTKRGRRMKIDDNNNPHHTHPLAFVAPSQYPHQHHILHSAPGRAHNSHHHPHHLAISSLSDDGSHSHSQLDSMSAANTEGFEEGDEVQEEDGDDDEDDNDSLRTFNTSRLQNVRKAGSVPGDGSKNHDSNGNQNNAGKEDGNGGAGKVADHIQTNGAYCAREEALKKEEEAGRLKFEFLYNDGNDQHMIWLIGLKNVFARQLPNMPKDYIVRLLMDRNHKSVVIIKANQVVGGVTYRPYPSQRFGEIAFCAITADEQVKGYGTRLMNHVKQFARERDSLTHFLTYADNNAVGYFLKQGFTKDIQLEKERWHGYIKDYDGAILLECKIDLRLPYTDLPAMVRMQRQALDEKIRVLSNRHSVYTGIEIAKKEAGVPRKPLKVEDVPGLSWTVEQWGHSNYRLSSSVPDGQASRQVLHAFMKSLWKYISEQTDAWPFKEPVDPREVPDYYDIIKDPIDLKTMLKRLESEQYYVTLDMFVADVKRMFSNAKTYNSPETVYYKCANKLETFFRNKLHAGLLNKAQ